MALESQTLSSDLAVSLICLLVGLSSALQSAEFLKLRGNYWPWRIIRDDYSFLPPIVRKFLDLTLTERSFLTLNVLRLIASLIFVVFPSWSLAILMFIAVTLTCFRYRGSFNGGSDFMSLITLIALTLILFFDHPAMTFCCLWYVAIQSCSSYFIGGLVKLKKSNWRNGTALAGFLGSTIYKESPLTHWMRNHKVLAFVGAWFAMLFELTFPFLAFMPLLTLPTLVIGIAFHIANAYLFGLNRFTFAWVATYPAIYYCQQSLGQSFS